MKLETMEKIVLEILEHYPIARKDDYILMWFVCAEINPNLGELNFADVLCNHKELCLPNWETVTRCRRKIQEKRTDLCDENTTRRRHKREEEFKEYARS